MEQRILEFIERAEQSDDRAFELLALDLFAFQYERVPVYRRFCRARGWTPSNVRRWPEIPALPAEAFKERVVEEPRRWTFLSSGTTQGGERRSRHELDSLAVYERSAMEHFRRMVMADEPGPSAILVLGPTSTTHPHSSLGRMFTWCGDRFGLDEAEVAFDAAGRVDVERAVAWLEAHARESAPVLVLAVTSALTAVFEEIRRRPIEVRLPAASRIVDTGGSKGGHALSAKGVLKAAWRFLHVPAYQCINEYGMTEMLSQLYDDALLSRCEGSLLPRSKVGPPWLRTVVVDPTTLEPVPDGEPGLLRHLDLANWESVAALQTLDVGRACGRGLELGGRAPAAEARGCSQLMTVVERERATS